jgi:hypothetical protein
VNYRVDLDPADPRERSERDYCALHGKPWKRLTVAEQDAARQMIIDAAEQHPRLRWHIPRYPWPVGAVWPERALWGIPVRWPYVHGPVVLTARRSFRRRYVVAELEREVL